MNRINEREYTVKEIIIALREKYQENELMLQALKSHVRITNERIEDVNFFVTKESEKQPDIYFEIVRRNKGIKRLLEDFFLINHDGNMGNLLKDNNDFYVSTSNYSVDIVEPNSFKQKVDTTLTSTFVNNVSNEIQLQEGRLRITPNAIELFTKADEKGKVDLKLCYDSFADSVMFETSKKIKYDLVTISQYMKIRVPESKLNPYIVSVLKEKEENFKNSYVIIPNFDNKKFKTKEYELDILETSEYISFVKKKANN